MDQSDKVASVASVEADDDADALAKAASTIRVPPNYPVIEMWLEKRMIGRVAQRDHDVD